MEIQALRSTSGPRRREVLLAVVGLAMVAAGYAASGRHTQAVTTLIAVGGVQLTVAIMLPLVKKLDIAPNHITAEVETHDATGNGSKVRLERLEDFAFLMLGHAKEAKSLVHEIVESRQGRVVRRMSWAEAGVVIRTLVDSVVTSDDRRWLRGGQDPLRSSIPEVDTARRDIVRALAELPPGARAAFLLNVDWLLSRDDIAELLQLPPNEVGRQIDDAKEALQSSRRSAAP